MSVDFKKLRQWSAAFLVCSVLCFDSTNMPDNKETVSLYKNSYSPNITSLSTLFGSVVRVVSSHWENKVNIFPSLARSEFRCMVPTRGFGLCVEDSPIAATIRIKKFESFRIETS
jgi:hypothetical protein